LRCALGAVEGEDAFVPAGPGQALGLIRLEADAGGHNEDVVGQDRAVVESDLVPLQRDRFDLVLVKDDPAAQLAPPRPHDLVEACESERHEEQSGLVDVTVVSIDDVNLCFVGVEPAAQSVRGHRAARSGPEDHDPLPCHARSFARDCAGAIGAVAEHGCGQLRG
jgi:hypothetical protein